MVNPHLSMIKAPWIFYLLRGAEGEREGTDRLSRLLCSNWKKSEMVGWMINWNCNPGGTGVIQLAKGTPDLVSHTAQKVPQSFTFYSEYHPMIHLLGRWNIPNEKCPKLPFCTHRQSNYSCGLPASLNCFTKAYYYTIKKLHNSQLQLCGLHKSRETQLHYQQCKA